MTRLLNLFVLLAPWVALFGGAALLTLATLHLTSVRPLPRIDADQRLSALAALVLGVALMGLGATFLITDGATGYSDVYLAWLALATLSGVLAAVAGR